MTLNSSRLRRGAGRVAGLALVLTSVAALAPREALAQWSTTYEQFYLQAKHNWQFRHQYQSADRLFNAFDFGHAILYETLWSKPNAPASELEEKWYNRLTKEILVHPPRVPLEEGAIEIRYAQLAPEAKVMFEWAHILHRQMYDVLSDERLSQAQKDAEVARLLAYYRTRPDVAFSSKPKSMELMQEQPYSLAFRQNYPKFNGLIWAYHWLQVGLYEPLIVNPTPELRQAGVRATVARFWQMLEDPPRNFPYQMPMTAAIAPQFSARYPEAAIIFDNLHSMHDVISDILANPSVPRDRKRTEIMRAARLFRDDTSYVMPVVAWRTMAEHMGIENMGGPAVNFLPALAEPTVTYGAVMTHDRQTGEMTGFKYGSATGGAHAEHGAAARTDSTPAGRVDHAAMGHGAVRPDSAAGAVARDTTGRAQGAVDHAAMGHMTTDSASAQDMMRLHELMMRDRVIRQRILADTAMRRLMTRVMGDSAMQQLMRSEPRAGQPAQRPPARRTPARQTPAADPHAGHRPATPAKKPPPPKPPAKPDSTAGVHQGHTPPA